MTRIHGRLFDDERGGILAVKPSAPFFGVSRDERFYPVNGGSIDIELLPTPPGVFYFVGYKEQGDVHQTAFTLRWRVPKTGDMDITPGATPEKQPPAASVTSATVYERVQLKRVSDNLSEVLAANEGLNTQLAAAQARIDQLEAEMRNYKMTTDSVLSKRDQTIAQLQETLVPEVQTVYVDRPVPPELLEERVKRLEQENIRLSEVNAEYYKSVVELHQLKLDRAHNTNPVPVEDFGSSPQKKLLRKLLGK